MKSKLLFGTMILASTLGASATLGTVGTNSLAVPSSDQPFYTVEQRPDGYLRVYVDVSLEDPVARDHYAAQQRSEAARLARLGVGDVPIQITFARPLPIDELRSLVQRTGLGADLVIFEARDSANGLHTVAVPGSGLDVVDLDSLAPVLIEHGPLRIVGATVVSGMVSASEDGLGKLAADPLVYLPDVTAYRLMAEVAARYGVSPDRIQVSLPSPHWYLSTER